MTSTRPRNLALAHEIPTEIISRLHGHEALLRRIRHSEDFASHDALDEIVRELDAICRADGIVGVHYTRGHRGQISAQGLLTRSGQERRDEFLDAHGHRFTSAQRQRLVAGWSPYFNAEQNRIRDSRVWFNTTRIATSIGGAEPLLAHYGGEVVYMPFSRDEEIEEILRSLGDPMIVECALRTDSVRTFCEYPWGRTWLSSYHCSVNPDAFQWDVDLFTEVGVPPDSILRIEIVGTGRG